MSTLHRISLNFKHLLSTIFGKYIIQNDLCTSHHHNCPLSLFNCQYINLKPSNFSEGRIRISTNFFFSESGEKNPRWRDIYTYIAVHMEIIIRFYTSSTHRQEIPTLPLVIFSKRKFSSQQFFPTLPADSGIEPKLNGGWIILCIN